MTNTKTTIVLGAGASVHYGFPTGSGLIDSIISSSRFFNWYVIGGEYYINEIWQARKFSKLLKEYDPLSIDRFLSMYKDKKEIVESGKKLIAHEIIKRQRSYFGTRYNKENWYKYLYDFIFADNDYKSKLDNDEFRIITFNYDLSLEYFFHSRLEKTPSLSKEEAWKIFLKLYSKIYHIYGSVYDYIEIGKSFECRGGSEDRYTYPMRYAEKANHSSFDEASYFHNNIKVIGEEREISKEFKSFKSHLQQSQRIFILGFGFDNQNTELIGLNNEFISNFAKILFCTNFKNLKIINEKIDNIVKGNHKAVISDKQFIALYWKILFLRNVLGHYVINKNRLHIIQLVG
jgi:hypothetical protein